jgi:hypothetical protein
MTARQRSRAAAPFACKAGDDQPCPGIDRPLDHERQRATTVSPADYQPPLARLAGLAAVSDRVMLIPRQLLGLLS